MMMDSSRVVTDRQIFNKSKASSSSSSNDDVESSSSDYGSEDTTNIDTEVFSTQLEPNQKSMEEITANGKKAIILESTPNKFEKASDFVKEFAPPSMEYSYYVIASPAVGRKMSSSNRSYSYVSMSSRDSSSSDLSSVLQPKKTAPKSRGLLQSVKDKLLIEIENINMELVKMDSEKLILVNLRNSSILYRDMICQSERNNQGIPNPQKLRGVVESIELKIQDEEIALSIDLCVPHIDDIKKDLKDFLKICNLITQNKANIKMSLVEELLCAAGKLFGVVDTVLQIFYEENTNSDGSMYENDDDVNNDVIVDDVDGDQVASFPDVSPNNSMNENGNRYKNKDGSNNTSLTEYLKKQNGNIDTTHSSPISEELGKVEQLLKILSKKLIKAKKLLKAIERLSSGNPKPKSLRTSFKDINNMISEQTYVELQSDDSWLKAIMDNIIDLQNHLLAERPGERELEHIKIIVGELTGRINMVLKSNMFE